MDLAYPEINPLTRNIDQTRLLLNMYMLGLRDQHIVERLVKHGHPETFHTTMTLFDDYEVDEYRLLMALEDGIIPRDEEPMEFGATADQVVLDPNELWQQVCGMTRQFTKLLVSLQGDCETTPPM